MNAEFKPLVSVCVVAYNQEKYIRQGLLSIIDQETDFEFEIIVSDDCSSDKTPNIILEISQKYPKLIKAIYLDKNIGAFENYIQTHNSASGNYIAHMDGDDFWLPGKLAQQVRFLENHPECSAAYSNAFLINKFGEKFGKFNKKLPQTFNRNFLLQRGNFLNASSLIYRRILQEKIIPKNLEFIDYQIHLRCSIYGLLGYINEPLVSYRVLSTGIASKQTKKVTTLYWGAITEAFESDGMSKAMKSAITDFMGMIFCRGVIEMDSTMVRKWLREISNKTKLPSSYIFSVGLLKALFKILNSAKKRMQRRMRFSIIFANL